MAITNDKELEAWLKEQEQPAHITIAARAALRVFPLVTTRVEKNEYVQEITLLTGRALLTSLVARKWPTSDVKSAAGKAADAAAATTTSETTAAENKDTTTNEATKAAVFAAGAATNSYAHPRVAYTLAYTYAHGAAKAARAAVATYAAKPAAAATYADTAITANDPFTIDLWHGVGMPEVIEKEWGSFQALAKDGSPWAFWREWYQSLLDAKPMNWGLQKEIALIPNKDWDKGVEHIAQIIAGIKARFVTVNIPLSEEILQNPETGKFYSIPVPARKPDLLKTTLEKVSDALDDALNDRNGLMKNSREVHVLRKCVKDYAHNPERIEMDFVDVHTGLVRQIDNKEIPMRSGLCA